MINERKWQPVIETGIGCRCERLSDCLSSAVERYREINGGENPDELLVDEKAAEKLHLIDGHILESTRGYRLAVSLVQNAVVKSSDPRNPNPVPIFLSGPTGFIQLCQECPKLNTLRGDGRTNLPDPSKVISVPSQDMPLSAPLVDMRMVEALKKVVETMFPREAATIEGGAQLGKLIIDLFLELKRRRKEAKEKKAGKVVNKVARGKKGRGKRKTK